MANPEESVPVPTEEEEPAPLIRNKRAGAPAGVQPAGLSTITSDAYLDRKAGIVNQRNPDTAQDIKQPNSLAVPVTFQPPTTSDLKTVVLAQTDPDDIISEDRLNEIDTEWAQIVPDEKVRRLTYYILARACYDNGSSPYTSFPGLYKVDSTTFRLSQLVEIIRRCSTLRRFASYWAKTLYSESIESNRPPAKWAKRGFSHATRFAAFDFFTAVVSEHTPPPKGLPVRVPSDAEIAANLTHKQIALARSTNTLKNLNPEINGGGVCTPEPIAYRAASCR